MNRTSDFETKSIRQLLVAYAVPAVIGQVISCVYNLTDRIIIGQGIGALAIAGLAITMPIMSLITAFGLLSSIGAGNKLSIALGQKDMPMANRILGNSILLTLLLGAIYVVLGYLFMDSILLMFGATAQTIAYAREYLLIVIPGTLFTSLTNTLTAAMRSDGYPIKSMYVMGMGAVINIILDVLFIYGLDYGIAGAAWATTISMSISAVVSVMHFMNPKSDLRFMSSGFKPDFAVQRSMMYIGCSPFLMNVSASAVIALYNSQLLRYGGDVAVGAYGVVSSISLFFVLVALGVSSGMQPIVGYNFGAGRNDRLKEAFKLTLWINVLFMGVGTILCELFPELAIRAFSNDTELLGIGVVAVMILAAMFPLSAFQITVGQFFLAINKPRVSIIGSLSRQLAFFVPLSFLVPALFVSVGLDGLTGVWVSSAISEVLASAMFVIFLYRERKVFVTK